MERDGIELNKISPKAVVRQAFNAKYIEYPDVWLKMISDRNLMSHTYDFAKFEVIIQSIRDSYLPLLDEWYFSLLDDIHNA